MQAPKNIKQRAVLYFRPNPYAWGPNSLTFLVTLSFYCKYHAPHVKCSETNFWQISLVELPSSLLFAAPRIKQSICEAKTAARDLLYTHQEMAAFRWLERQQIRTIRP